jgi:hypothetical protein
VGCWDRERVRWGFWERRAKKLYYLVAPLGTSENNLPNKVSRWLEA